MKFGGRKPTNYKKTINSNLNQDKHTNYNSDEVDISSDIHNLNNQIKEEINNDFSKNKINCYSSEETLNEQSDNIKIYNYEELLDLNLIEVEDSNEEIVDNNIFKPEYKFKIEKDNDDELNEILNHDDIDNDSDSSISNWEKEKILNILKNSNVSNLDDKKTNKISKKTTIKYSDLLVNDKISSRNEILNYDLLSDSKNINDKLTSEICDVLSEMKIKLMEKNNMILNIILNSNRFEYYIDQNMKIDMNTKLLEDFNNKNNSNTVNNQLSIEIKNDFNIIM